MGLEGGGIVKALVYLAQGILAFFFIIDIAYWLTWGGGVLPHFTDQSKRGQLDRK